MRELLFNLSKPYYFGFSMGHSHLNDRYIAEIREVMSAGIREDIRDDYENKFSRLVGQGYGLSFAAGRMAFYSLMREMDIGPGDEVILTGFTCSVMPNAVWRVGAVPVFADIDLDTFGSDPSDIERKITTRTKMIVAQHSFGIPCKIDEIAALAERHGIFLLEDAAICLDSQLQEKSVGNWGGAAIFSTDHTKPLNTLVGGFFYTNDPQLYKKMKEAADKMPELPSDHQQRLFDQLLFERKYYHPKHYHLGRIVDYTKAMKKKTGLRKVDFFEDDYRRMVSQTYPYPARMPSFLALLGICELERWGEEKRKRKDILTKYLKIAKRCGLSSCLPGAYADHRLDIVPLRFVFQHRQRSQYQERLRGYLDIGGVWFQSPIICCPEGPGSLGYSSGSCLRAEEASQNVTNYPCVVADGWEDIVLELFESSLKPFHN